MNYLASAVQAVPGDDFTVYAYFSDGTVRLAEIKPLIAKGGVFAQLASKYPLLTQRLSDRRLPSS